MMSLNHTQTKEINEKKINREIEIKTKEEGREITTSGQCVLPLLVVVGFLHLCLSLFCS